MYIYIYIYICVCVCVCVCVCIRVGVGESFNFFLSYIWNRAILLFIFFILSPPLPPYITAIGTLVPQNWYLRIPDIDTLVPWHWYPLTLTLIPSYPDIDILIDTLVPCHWYLTLIPSYPNNDILVPSGRTTNRSLLILRARWMLGQMLL